MMFTDITSFSDIWQYIEQVFIPRWYSNSTDFLSNSDRLGTARIRQVRVRNDSCYIFERFRARRSSCYGYYSAQNADTGKFGSADSTAWIYLPESVTKNLPVSHQYRYPGDGYYIDFPHTDEEAIRLLLSLKQNLWLDCQTRGVFLRGAFYNPNVNLFLVLSIDFEITPNGHILKYLHSQAGKIFDKNNKKVRYIFIAVSYSIITYYMISDIRDICFFKLKGLKSFWLYMDSTMFALVVYGLTIRLSQAHYGMEALRLIAKYPDRYGNIEWVIERDQNYIIAFGFIALLLHGRMLHYLNFNETMAQFNSTMKRCACDVCVFFCLFFALFIAFADFGYTMFGRRAYQFRSFIATMFSLLRTLYSQYIFQDVIDFFPTIGSIYCITFVASVYFIFLEVFLSIIHESFSDVRTELTVTTSDLQLVDVMNAKLQKAAKKLGFRFRKHKKIIANQQEMKLRHTLRRVGFTALEIEMFFNRYNIDPLAIVVPMSRHKIISMIKNWEYIASGAIAEVLPDYQVFRIGEAILKRAEETVASLHSRVDDLLTELDTAIGISAAKKHST